MSTQHHVNVKIENPLESFKYFTIQKYNYENGKECEDEVILSEVLDPVTFDSDPDGKIRRSQSKEKLDSLIITDEEYDRELIHQMVILCHLLHPKNYDKNGPFLINESPEMKIERAQSTKPTMKMGQWSNGIMGRKQGYSGIVPWLMHFGPTVANELYDYLSKGEKKTFIELSKKSKEILGWNNVYHMTKVFKEIGILRPQWVDRESEVLEGTYAKFAFKTLLKGEYKNQRELLEVDPELKQILEYPYNVEHNLCGWVKWLMYKQDIKKRSSSSEVTQVPPVKEEKAQPLKTSVVG